MAGKRYIENAVVITRYKNHDFLSFIPSLVYLPRIFKTKFENKVQTIFSIIANSCQLLFISKKYDTYVTTSLTSGIALLWVSKLKRMSDKKYILTNFYLHQLGEKKIIIKFLNFLFKTHDVTIALHSKHEQKIYTKRYPQVKAIFMPLCQNPSPTLDVEQGDYVFAGGYTNRDYDTLFRCAGETPEIEYIIVCSKLNNYVEPIPSNVTIFKDIPRKEFDLLLEGSKLVVVNLKDETGAAGQMVTLSAISLQKPVIYTNYDTIAHYFKDTYSGLSYSAGNHAELKEKILYLFNNEQKRIEMGKNAHQEYMNKYTRGKYLQAFESLLAGEMPYAY